MGGAEIQVEADDTVMVCLPYYGRISVSTGAGSTGTCRTAFKNNRPGARLPPKRVTQLILPPADMKKEGAG